MSDSTYSPSGHIRTTWKSPWVAAKLSDKRFCDCTTDPDPSAALTEIVTNGVFYARLPKWDDVKGAERALN